MNRWWWYLITLMAACISTLAVADDRADYNRQSGQSAERYIAIGAAKSVTIAFLAARNLPRRGPRSKGPDTGSSS